MAKVLVIDDDKVFVNIMAHTLRKHGHDVDTALDGQAGEAAFDATPYDCVVCDLVMPNQEGLETIRYMRRERPGVAIVAVSGGLGPTAKFDVLNAAKQFGAHVCLKKPLDVTRLTEAVDTALHMSALPASQLPNA